MISRPSSPRLVGALGLCALLAVACQDEPAPAPTPQAVSAAPSAAGQDTQAEDAPAPGAGRRPTFQKAPAPEPSPAPRRPWRWVVDGRGEALSQRSLTVGQTAAKIDCQVESSLEPREIAVACERTSAEGHPMGSFRHELEPDFVDQVALASDGRHLLIAHHSRISSGGRLIALGLGLGRPFGGVVWQTQLEALGPVVHSKYRNDIQLEVRGDRVLVHGEESSGAYLEVRRVADGELVAHRRVDPARAQMRWPEGLAIAPRQGGHSSAMGTYEGQDAMIRLDHRASRLTLENTRGEPVWSVRLERVLASMHQVRLLQHRERVFVLDYGAEQPEGPQLSAHRLSDGHQLWSTQPSLLGGQPRVVGAALLPLGDGVVVHSQLDSLGDPNALRQSFAIDADGRLRAVRVEPVDPSTKLDFVDKARQVFHTR